MSTTSLKTTIMLSAILLLALILRVIGLTSEGLWFDEANGVLFATAPLSEIPGLLAADSSPPLYYLILHFWIACFGDGEIAVRSLSLLCGLLLIIAIFFQGKKIAGPKTGLGAALFIAICPLAIFYSQQARMYSLLPLLALLSFHFLNRLLTSGKNLHLLAFALTTTAALYTHNFAFHLLPPLALTVLIAGKTKRLQLKAAAGFILIFLFYLPWLPSFLGQLQHHEHYSWFITLWRNYSFYDPWCFTILSFSPAGEASMVGTHNTSGWLGIPALAVLALAILGVWTLWRQRHDHPLIRTIAYPLFLIIPMLTALLASNLATPHYVPARVDQMMLPAFALLVGLGLASLRPSFSGPTVTASLLLIGLAGWWKLPGEIPLQCKGGDREAAIAIAKKLQPDDVLLCTSYTNRTLEYYLKQMGHTPVILAFPGRAPGFWYPDVHWQQNDFREKMRRHAEKTATLVKQAASHKSRIFMVKVTNPQAPYPQMAYVALQEKAGLVPLETWGFYRQNVLGKPFSVIRGALK